jgi:hypothetical protein
VPIRKNHLTRSERAKYLIATKQLKDQGVIQELPTDWQELAEGVNVLVGRTSSIYVIAAGQILYAVHVCLICQIDRFALTDFDIVADWDNDIYCSYDETEYKFARGSLEFDCKTVLNHRFHKALELGQQGNRLDGWLLGTGLRPVPTRYGPGHPAPLTLTFFDRSQRACDTHMQIGVDRTARIPAWFNALDATLKPRPAIELHRGTTIDGFAGSERQKPLRDRSEQPMRERKISES